MPHSAGTLLSGLVRAQVGEPAERWLDDARAIARASDVERLLSAYTAAPKRVGRAALSVDEAARRDVALVVPNLSLEDWTVYDAARAILLLEVAERTPTENAFVSAATACYESGDSREQQSWLRAVSLLPHPARFLVLTIDACRTNIRPVFESIACGNPYPSRHFPDRNFNQLVLKALFIGVPLSEIVGLSERLTPELTRMARDYAVERRAAGRSVPADITLAMMAAASTEEQPQ